MSPGANVSSVEALQDWYAALVEFRTDAQNALTSVSLALQRAADWLIEQRDHWRRQLRKAEDAVVQARTELRNRQYEDWSGRTPDTTVQEKNLRRALDHLEFVEQQIERTRRWISQLPTLIEDTYDGPARALGFFLDSDLSRALAGLLRQLSALDQYRNLPPAPPSPPSPPSPPASGASS